jgi:hypothetical protein
MGPRTIGRGYVIGSHKAQGLLEDGRRLLERGDPREAALVLSRLLLLEPDHAEALSLMTAARAALAEAERRAQEALGSAEAALAAGERETARQKVEQALAAGADHERAHALLDRLDPRGGRMDPPPAAEGAEPPAHVEPPARSGWSRAAFIGLCAALFTVMGVGVASTWPGLLARLTEAPSPRSAPLATSESPGSTVGDRTVARARRLLESGEARAALSVLDTVSPQDPAYPFARQLRGHAQRALKGARQ